MKNIFISFVLFFSVSGSLPAAEVRVAVASNFKFTLGKLAADFKVKTGNDVIISSASSGKLYAQIRHGAPYDVLLAADMKVPQALIKSGHASEQTCFIYGRGQLVLWSKNKMAASSTEHALNIQSVKHIAIANPRTAPYGRAAEQYLRQLDNWLDIQPRLVTGESVGQAFQFVASGNAQLGFVALSHVLQWDAKQSAGQYWVVPISETTSLAQCGVILKRTKEKQAANSLVSFLLSEESQALIKASGYRVD